MLFGPLIFLAILNLDQLSRGADYVAAPHSSTARGDPLSAPTECGCAPSQKPHSGPKNNEKNLSARKGAEVFQ